MELRIKAYKIRVRDKKNITTKCDGKRLPHFRTSALTHSLLHLCSLWRTAEDCHHQRNYSRRARGVQSQTRGTLQAHQRASHVRDWTRSLTDPKFQVVTFDGADQAKTRVPQEWRKNVHGEYVSNSALVQNFSQFSCMVREYASMLFLPLFLKEWTALCSQLCTRYGNYVGNKT